jgi:hypothetical protein
MNRYKRLVSSSHTRLNPCKVCACAPSRLSANWRMSAQLPLACPFLGAHRRHRGVHGARGVAAGARRVRAGAAVQRRGQGLRGLAPGQRQVSCCQGSGAGLHVYHRPASVPLHGCSCTGIKVAPSPPLPSLSLSLSPALCPLPLYRSLASPVHGSSLSLLFSFPSFCTVVTPQARAGGSRERQRRRHRGPRLRAHGVLTLLLWVFTAGSSAALQATCPGLFGGVVCFYSYVTG